MTSVPNLPEGHICREHPAPHLSLERRRQLWRETWERLLSLLPDEQQAESER